MKKDNVDKIHSKFLIDVYVLTEIDAEEVQDIIEENKEDLENGRSHDLIQDEISELVWHEYNHIFKEIEKVTDVHAATIFTTFVEYLMAQIRGERIW